MQEFDKTKCLNNIYYLAKQKEIKIGDLERQAGISVGYMSRLNKEDNNANPGIEFLFTAANMLGVTVDSLCGVDFTTLSSTETYLMSFIDELITRSNDNQLYWGKETKIDLANVDCGRFSDSHPLFKGAVVNGKYSPIYCSGFNEGYSIRGTCYKLNMPKRNYSSVLYLMCVGNKNTSAKDIYELYLVQNREPKPLATSANPLFRQKLEDLYSAANEACSHPRLETDITDVIDAFMNGENGSSDFSGCEDLPF